jgi:hypothetical protein
MVHASFIRISSLCALVFAVMTLHAQTADRPAHKLDWALKVQAYSPLSWLAEPLNGKRDFPFTPRFWTGEVELGFSERSSVQLSVGVRRYRWEGVNALGAPAMETYRGLRGTLAYRHYLRTDRFGQMSGPYLAPFFRWASGGHTYDFGGELAGTSENTVISGGLEVGWQILILDHFLVGVGCAPEIGRIHTLNSINGGDQFSNFDYQELVIWRKGEGYPQRVSFAPSFSFALGWKF